MKRFYTGVATFSLVLGLLIGSSNSPVVGAAITAIFGVAVGLLSLVSGKEGATVPLNLKAVGDSLSLFSVSMVIGTFLGLSYRDYSKPSENYLLWETTTKPQSVSEALDWISVAETLKHSGFSKAQVLDVYSLRVKLKNSSDTSAQRNTYDEDRPYYKMLAPLLSIEQADKKVARGPASVPENY